MDTMAYGKPSVLGAVNGMIAGLVGITPGAGYVDGRGAIIIGVCAGIIPWLSMNKLQKTKLHDESGRYAQRVLDPWRGRSDGRPADRHPGQPGDARIYRHRQGRAGRERHRLLYGNAHQLVLQAEAAAFIIVFNVIATFIILKVISIFVTPLRMDDATLKVGDDAVHGETAYAIGAEGE